MTYTVRTTGRPIFKTIEIECEKCQINESHSIDVRGCDDEQIEQKMNEEILCPNCEVPMVRVFKTAPSISSIGKDGSESASKAMRKSFKQRFIKKEIDDTRHKWGRLFDDSLRSTAAQRLKNEK